VSDAKTVRRTVSGGQAARLGLLAAALVAPFYVDAFWVQVGVFAFAAMVAALGLNLLVGEAGQLSLSTDSAGQLSLGGDEDEQGEV
jgi:ABC-type branched-subunit amino acid transport system permease subunit